VAVRDDEATWLSSGNWQSSNQPAIDFLAPDADRRQIAAYNREWNVVVESPELAARFRAFLDADFATASSTPEAGILGPSSGPDLQLPDDALDEPATPGIEVFQPKRFTFDVSSPLTIQPILTPDNYVDVVLDLLRKRPRRSLYFQNQSLSPSAAPTAAWSELVRCLADHSRDERLDVRIIIRDIGPMRKKLESIQAAGIDMRRVRVQRGCHTKGIVIDGSTVLLGSHNWTNEGVEANRDASLLIRNRRIAQYYQRVFLHDWERLARPLIREAATAVPLARGREAAPQGPGPGRVMSWTEWMDG
jgi:phosphatidylserine/phosphatidylglycerophosphate/cardiolipin synthase-like enzyme